MPKSDQCSEGFVNYQKCHYENCSLSHTPSNIWADRFLSIQVDESDNTKWTIVNNRECLNQFGFPLPKSHCYGCHLQPKLEITWQLQRDSWTNARDFCWNKGAAWRLFDHFDGIFERLIVDQFNAFRTDGTFQAGVSKFWVGVYKHDGKFVAVSDETKELSQYFKQFNNFIVDRYLAVYAHSSVNGEIVVNDYHNYQTFIFPCSRYV